MFKKLAIAITLAVAPHAAYAQSVEEQIIAQLQAQGFTEIEVSRTLLGRIKLEAVSPTLERQLIVNPATGEVLRDFWEERDDKGRGDDKNVRVQVANPNDASDDADKDDDDRKNKPKDARKQKNESDEDDRDEDEDDDDDDKGKINARNKDRKDN